MRDTLFLDNLSMSHLKGTFNENDSLYFILYITLYTLLYTLHFTPLVLGRVSKVP